MLISHFQRDRSHYKSFSVGDPHEKHDTADKRNQTFNFYNYGRFFDIAIVS